MHSHGIAAWLLLLLFVLVTEGQNTTDAAFNRQRTMSLGVVVFPGWEPLDVFGPMEIFFQMSTFHKISLSVISHKTGPVSAMYPRSIVNGALMDVGHMVKPTIEATHTFLDAPALDVLLIPGGHGNYVLEQNNDTSVEDFIALRFNQLDYLLSVCTGAASLAKAGVLKGRRATTNKFAWAWVSSQGMNVSWVPTARWVQDGKIWTSSGVAAGMDMTYAFLRHFYGADESLTTAMNLIEYAPHTNASWDPFSIVHQVPGADLSSPLESCVKPVGY